MNTTMTRRVDAGEVIRCLADPDDQTLLSAAQFARDWLGLDAEDGSDAALARVVARADQTLREDMHVVSDQTAQVIRQLHAVLRAHSTAAAVELGRPDQDEQTIAATVTRVGPLDGLPPDAVQDAVQQTITRARAQAIEDAVTAVVAAQQAITDAETAHRQRMAALKATLRERTEAAIGAGRPAGLLAADLRLTRQRVDQIRKGTR